MDLSFLKQLNINNNEKGSSTGSIFYSNNHKKLISYSPVNGQQIATVEITTNEEYETIIKTAQNAYIYWSKIPAPKRGEIIRQCGESLRKQKENLGKLVAYEMGKSYQEGLGEVQEMIDIADFAVGLSRQLYGLTMHSERVQHRMFEQWQPLGIVGIISAFNFPVAVWFWNTAIAWITGNVCLWKPSEKTPLCAIACQKIISEVFKKNDLPEGLSNIIIGDSEIGKVMANDKRISLISATGSVKMGQNIATNVANRFGKILLELGGNNAMIITENAPLKIAIRAAVFGALGTAGQRCTSTRRLIIHKSIYKNFIEKLVLAYKQINIGNPLDTKNHIGPLIDKNAVSQYLEAIDICEKNNLNFLIKGSQLKINGNNSDCYVSPTIVETDPNFYYIKNEVFAPLLYVMQYDTIEEAIYLNNHVPQGLSSSIMTKNIDEMEKFLSSSGSDCGIANVNMGTSGAEIGGAFGGEKETGGGRESGSDAWKNYMRRQTVCINYGNDIPLAQGIKFEI